mgnify:CR=1 FL=1
MHRIYAISLLMITLVGCYAATRSTVDLTQAQQKLETARASGAPQQAMYAWTMADEYLKKAKDEWARSDYQAADALLKKSMHWADQAASIAKASGWNVPNEGLQDAPAEVPAEDSADEPTTTTQEGVWQ